jgi:hypothetical protein
MARAHSIPSELMEEIIKFADDLVVITPLIDEEDTDDNEENEVEDFEEEDHTSEPKPLLFNLEFNFRPTKISICCETWKNTTDEKTTIYFGMKERWLNHDSEEMPFSYLDDFLDAYKQKKQFRLRLPFKKYNSFGSSTVSIDTFSGKTYIEYTYDPYDTVFGFSVTVDVPDTEHLIRSFKHQLLQLWSKMEKST